MCLKWYILIQYYQKYWSYKKTYVFSDFLYQHCVRVNKKRKKKYSTSVVSEFIILVYRQPKIIDGFVTCLTNHQI